MEAPLFRQPSTAGPETSTLKGRPASYGTVRGSHAPIMPAFPQRLSMYTQPPQVEISVEQFEQWALDRLQVLKAIESAQLRNAGASAKASAGYEPDVMLAVVEAALKQNNLLLRGALDLSSVSASDVVAYDAERSKDNVSHFILRLAYCRSEELRAWLVRMETALFKYRWEMLYKDERARFIQRFNFVAITATEKKALAGLLRAPHSSHPDAVDKEAFFKIPFELVPDLVARRDVYLSEGFAYVPQSSLISVITVEFKHLLMAALEGTAKALPRMDDDDRLKPVLTNMSKNSFGSEFQTDSASLAGKVTHADVQPLSVHFPLCMQHLHSQLRRDSHLKHFGRMQFSLFLKGLGMSVEEALIYWRKSFSKLSDDQFQKGGYAYNIRHNYGQEGKRTNYTPFSCVKIITTNPPSHGDSHGCPFKHFGSESLQKMLLSHGMTESNSREVLDLSKAGHFQVACTKYFEITRGKFNPHAADDGKSAEQGKHNVMDTISHPNEFFELSVKAAGLTIDQKEKENAPEESNTSTQPTVPSAAVVDSQPSAAKQEEKEEDKENMAVDEPTKLSIADETPAGLEAV